MKSDTAYAMLKAEHEQRERYLQSLLDEIDRLKEENKKLRAVVDAARLFENRKEHSFGHIENEVLKALENLEAAKGIDENL